MPAIVIFMTCHADGGFCCIQGSSWLDPSLETAFGPFSECAQGHLAVKPRKGTLPPLPPPPPPLPAFTFLSHPALEACLDRQSITPMASDTTQNKGCLTLGSCLVCPGVLQSLATHSKPGHYVQMLLHYIYTLS